jgi:hypothetical protein
VRAGDGAEGGAAVTARPDPFHVHVGDQVLAALADAGRLLSTPEIQDRTGYGMRYGQLIYTVLARLARDGEVEKATTRCKPVYWRRTRPQVSLPPFTVCKNPHRRRRS